MLTMSVDNRQIPQSLAINVDLDRYAPFFCVKIAVGHGMDILYIASQKEPYYAHKALLWWKQVLLQTKQNLSLNL